MKKKLLTFLCSAMLVAALLVGVSGCSMSEEERTADCYNGQFVGEQEKDTGVLSFKGIPYAKQPTGERRWKAPEAVAKSDSTKKADKFGHSSIQYEWHSEPASSHSIGEDCLTLNVWTKNLEGSDKPIMFYVHGGGFAGTIQAFVPNSLVEIYKATMEHTFGEGCCYVLRIRDCGGVKVA